MKVTMTMTMSTTMMRSWLGIVFLLLVIAAGGFVSALKEKIVLDLRKLQSGLGEMKHSEICQPQRSRRVNGATILEIRHHSYCSDKNENQVDKAWNVLASDNARISNLRSHINSKTSDRIQDALLEAQIPLRSGAKLQTLNYIVTIELGGKKMTVIMDTGSDLTWVQCKPCTSCYNQQDPLFDPSASTSYHPIPCNSTVCDSLQSATGVSSVCSTDRLTCNYALSYGDGSSSSGMLARDKISLASTTIEGFLFGCGQSNQGLFGGTSGLMGFGRSQLSLVSQTTSQFGGVFSYCLPSREYESSGSLTFGNDYSAYRNSTPFVYTRMIYDTQQMLFYFLNLTGMSVGGVGIQASGFSTNKVLIDSGTVISRLAPSVYTVLKSEFVNQFSGYPQAPAYSILDTCFNLTGYEEVNVPTIRLEFEGNVQVEVDASGIMYFVKPDASQVCLALASLSDEYETGIIGNYQQKNIRVIYDVTRSTLGFAEESCDYS